MKIIFTGGGTAGHIYPIVAIVREIRKNHAKENFQFFYLGPKDQFAAAIFGKEDILVRTVLAGKLRRYFSFKNLLDIFKAPIGFFQSFYYLFIISPDIIFSKGGYGSLPVIMAGWILRIPIFLHESDVAPGLANRIAGRFCIEIFTAFPVKQIKGLPIKKMISVGSPVRQEILGADFEGSKKALQLAGNKAVILFLGGSQGAQKINDIVLAMLPDILYSFEVVHQTGKENFGQIKAEAEVVVGDDVKKYYHLTPFLEEKELAAAYRVADLIVGRAGAGSIFEIASAGKPSILVPLPNSAQNHQVKNAYAFAENGASIVLEEPNFTPHFLVERLRILFSQPQKLREMAGKAREFSRPLAAKVTAEYLVSYLTQ